MTVEKVKKVEKVEKVVPVVQSNAVSPEEAAAWKREIKQQVIDELKDERALALEEAAVRRVEEAKERQAYFDKMKASPEPWVEIIGWVENDQGVKVELEWNDAFIDFLKVEGVTGTDEDQVVQKWVALLLQNIAADMGDQATPEGESDFQG